MSREYRLPAAVAEFDTGGNDPGPHERAMVDRAVALSRELGPAAARTQITNHEPPAEPGQN